MNTPSPGDESVGLTVAQLQSVLNISRLFAVTADLDALLHKIAEAVCSLVQCERASIWLADPATKELFTTVILGAPQLRVPANRGIVGAAFTANKTVNVPDAYEDARFNRDADKSTGFRTRSLMAIPMVDIDGKPVGVIQALNKLPANMPFGAQDESLVQLLADQAGVAIQRHHLQEIAKSVAEMKRELDLARKVQQALLPKMLPTLAGFDLHGWAKPASATGGDAYDLWTLPDGRLGILLFDASGHGLAPALVVSQARTLVRAFCDGVFPLPHPHDVLVHVHNRMCQDLPPDRFITAFLGFLSADGELQWQSAGHGPILSRASADEPLVELEPTLSPINLMEDQPPAPPPLRIDAGGMLAVLSDGISEAFNPAQELFGVDRLRASLDRQRNAPASVAAQSLLDSIIAWQGHDQPVDDQTIVLLRRTG
jgi:serine phosphatase RsbU (regulator of sigma subunit)